MSKVILSFPVLSRCGLLTFHIVLPYSFLHFPYVEAAIRATNYKNICNCSVSNRINTDGMHSHAIYIEILKQKVLRCLPPTSLSWRRSISRLQHFVHLGNLMWSNTIQHRSNTINDPIPMAIMLGYCAYKKKQIQVRAARSYIYIPIKYTPIKRPSNR